MAPLILRFNSKLQSAFVVVRDAAGKQIDKGDGTVDKKDPEVIRVSLPILEPGMYKVQWRALSAETHKINGDFKFNVNP
jgi:methionine-rich copper-binding protein CopC